MNDILAEITKKETEAEEIINNAKKHAATIIESSKIEIEKRKKEMMQEAQNHVEQAIKEKRLLAQFDSEKIKEETTAKIISLKEKAQENSDKAVAFILSAI